MAFSLLGWELFGDKTLCHDRFFGNHSFLQNLLHITVSGQLVSEKTRKLLGY
jgi:hypothetical protein